MSELTQQIIEYEQGELDEEQTIQLFQELYDSGLVWNLQGHYGRFAYQLIEAGLINTQHTGYDKMSNDSYNEEINKWKAKSFFLNVLKNEGRPYINSDAGVELLSDILTNKLLEKLEREKRK